MTNIDTHNSQFNSASLSLEAVFAEGRAQQPDFSDDNFTKTVLNRLPSKPSRVANSRNYFDLIGLLFGLLITYLVVEPTQITASVFALLPNNVSISLTSMLLVSAVLSSLALAAWWGVERDSQTLV
jgi:hypothetical protein